MSGREPLLQRSGVKKVEENRLPPNQVLTPKWPVLTHGEIPEVNLDTWRLHGWGRVRNDRAWTWEEFRSLPQVEVVSDIHCVTRWSRYDNRWRGVASREILERVQPLPEVRFVMVHAHGGYCANLPLEQFVAEDILFAHEHDGKPLAREHGGPCRMVVPQLYFWKSVKWVVGLEFLSVERAGFWEQYGYHMRGNPWAEERFQGR
ncbi:MAG: sulfite oxidase-like oxidoreductase [Acidobacteria bacterium]|nr:sulfite oxidase-like oxidoreductase [Acidobacteriota bacterium]